MSKQKKRKKNHFDKNQEGGGTISVKLFILKYLLLIAAFVFIKNFKSINELINIYGQYNELIAFFTSKVLTFINISSNSQGSTLYLPSISLNVGFECSGIEAVLMYSVAVIAYPAKWKNKLIGIVAGFCVIQVLNLGRIFALAFSAVHFKSIFEVLHVYVAQSIVIATALLIFIIYLNFLGDTKRIAT